MIRYEGVVSSFLGETAARLDNAFEFARTRRCVLFFDELDTIAKERSDEHETGEIKRVVSTLLLQIDRLPAHVILVGATNHGELLDRAAWRRFQIRAELQPPSRAQATRFLERLAARLGGDLGFSPRTLADKLAGASFAELEEFAIDVRRRAVLELPEATCGGSSRSASSTGAFRPRSDRRPSAASGVWRQSVGERPTQLPRDMPRLSKPGAGRQGERLTPQFRELTAAFDAERARLAADTPDEVDPAWWSFSTSPAASRTSATRSTGSTAWSSCPS